MGLELLGQAGEACGEGAGVGRLRKGSGEGTGSELLVGRPQAQKKPEKGQRMKGRCGSGIKETGAKN